MASEGSDTTLPPEKDGSWSGPHDWGAHKSGMQAGAPKSGWKDYGNDDEVREPEK
jgi:hypothetical protein